MSQDNNTSLAAKIASLSTLQTIITRMGTVSISIKTIFITVFGFFVSGYWLDGNFPLWQKFVPFLFVTYFFALLDSYYLSVEKKYRHIYEALSDEDTDIDVNFFNWKPYFRKFHLEALKSFSIWGFYIFVYVVYVLVVSVVYDVKTNLQDESKNTTYTSKLFVMLESQQKMQKEILNYLGERPSSCDIQYKIEDNITVDNEPNLSYKPPKKTTTKPIIKTCN
jgi:hypothetical protein